jgi:hypothetical protein
MAQLWSEQELNLLGEVYGKVNRKELEDLFPSKTYNAIKGAANRRLKIFSGKKKAWTKTELDILKTYYGRVSRKELLALLPGRTETTIESKAHNLKIYSIRNWSDADDTFLKDNYNLLQPSEIAKALNRTTASIYAKAQILNLTNKQLFHDTNFFATPNLLNSYWAGFIAADGCLYDKPAIVAIALNKKDTAHLERFAQNVKYSGKVKQYNHQSPRQYRENSVAKIAICGASQLVQDLNNNFNITSRKTATLKPPPLTEDLALAYICGVIDGDGCITRSSSYLKLQIVGTEDLLIWIKEIMDKHFPVSMPTARVSNVHKHKSIYEYGFCGTRAIHVLSALSQLPIPHMKRKWDKLYSLPQITT